MIEIYLKNNINYEANGDITLIPSLCEYNSENREITLEHPIDDIGRYKYIEADNVLSIYNKDKKKKEFYRIYSTNKTLDGVTAYARPIFYDLIDSILLDVRPTQKNGQEALDILLENTPFRGYSNIKTLSTSYYIRKNIVEALISDDENSFINRWGGELYLDNWDIYLNYRIGSDNGIRVEFGYNLESIEEVINFDEIATRVIPVGADGLMLEGDNPWIDSPNINKYSNIKSKVVEFSNVKIGTNEGEFATEELAREELKRLVNEAFENGLDMPVVTYTVSMVDLRDTTEYEQYKMLETVNEGDTVHIYVKKLDINLTTRVTKLNIDKITGRIISVELGSIVKNFFENQADISNRVNNILNSNGTVKAQSLEGTIDSLNTKFKAQRDIAQPQEIRAMLFEDSVEGSPTYGAMCLGTMGFMIANTKTVDGEWDWRTFGTGKGFTADEIVAGTLRAITLASLDESLKIDLQNGKALITKGILGSDKTYLNLTKEKFVSEGIDSSGNVVGLEISEGMIHSDSPSIFIRGTGKDGIRLESKKFSTLIKNDDGRIGGSFSIEEGKADFAIKDVLVIGNFKVQGDKNCIQKTENYGDILFYSTEDVNSLLTYTDIDNVYSTRLENNKYTCRIEITDIIKECINTSLKYNVYLNKIEQGDIWLSETQESFFVVESDRPISFKYKLEGRRFNFEDRTLDKNFRNEVKK